MQPASAQVALPTGGPSTVSASTDSSSGPNGSTMEPAQIHSTKAPGFVVPPPSFSYAVHGNANTNATTSIGGVNQSVPPLIRQHPGPGISPNTGASFSYNVSQTGPGKSLLQGTSSSGAVAQDSSITKPESLPGPPQSGGKVVSSAASMGLLPTWTSGPPFCAYGGRLGAAGTPGPLGLAPSTHVASGAALPSVASDSSVTVRSNMAGGPILPTPAFQQQVFSPYPSLAPTTANPQGLWLQPPQASSMAISPFMQYPAVFPSPFPFPGQGMTAPSMTLPNPRPPGVTPPGTAGGFPSSSTSVQQFAGTSTIPIQTCVPADTSKDGNGISTKDGVNGSEQIDAWTAHKTESGSVYYYNALTGESTYARPAGFNGQVDDLAAQPVPVTMEKVANTDWEIVTMNDGKKYYFNTKTKISSWQIPTEVSELIMRQESVQPKENLSRPDVNLSSEKVTASIGLSAPAISTGGRGAAALRVSGLPGTPSSALDLVKKKLQDAGTPVNSIPVSASSVGATLELNGSRTNDKALQSESNKDKLKDANGNENISDSSSDSEDADSGPTKEELVLQFKEMLKERGVAPFSKWDKELPKILFDPRFKAIPSYSERRSLFEHYVKTRAEEERKEKRAAQKAAIEGFKQLLEEASEDIDARTDSHTFRKKWGKDQRFEALDRKDRENLLNERVLPLKKAAEEKAQAIRAAATSSFKSMLRDKGDITVNSRWSRVKDSLRDDPRYKSVKHEDRESLFNDYIAELKATEKRLEQEAKARKDEQEKLKERERELRKRKEREEQEMERVRVKIRRKEAVESFQALLVETIKDPQISWTESKLKLEKDPQGRVTNADLDSFDTEKLFREHIKMLYERCSNEFRALLAETITAETAAAEEESEDGRTSPLYSWSTAKGLLKTDPRYNKMPRKEREVVWRKHVEELLLRKKQKAGDEIDNNNNKSEEKHVVDAQRRRCPYKLHTSSSSGSKRARDRR